MPQEYWIKLTADADGRGPYNGAQVRALAASKRIHPDSLITLDGKTWHAARRVKGLFPSTIAAPHVAAPLEFVMLENTPQPRVVTPPPTPAPAEDLPRPLKRRAVLPFTIVAVLVFLSCNIVTYTTMTAHRLTDNDDKLRMYSVALGACYVSLPLVAVAVTFWLIWINGIHADLRHLSRGKYGISPRVAIGVSLIPLFIGGAILLLVILRLLRVDLYSPWQVVVFFFIALFDASWCAYMPWRASRHLNRHLSARGLRRISPSSVMICQIASVVGGLLALSPLMYAFTMWQMRAGLDRLSSTSTRHGSWRR